MMEDGNCGIFVLKTLANISSSFDLCDCYCVCETV